MTGRVIVMDPMEYELWIAGSESGVPVCSICGVLLLRIPEEIGRGRRRLMPPRLPLMRALLLAIVLPIFPTALRAVPQNANKLARLDAVFLLRCGC